MTVIVNNVPPTINKPDFYADLNTDGARQGNPLSRDRILLLGHQLSAATAVVDTPTQIYSAKDARTKFGEGSPVALMAKALFDENPNLFEVWGVGVAEDGAAAAAAGSIAFATSSLTAGTLYVWIGSTRYSIGVAAGDTAAAIASAVEAKVAADADCPFGASTSSGTTNLACKVKGTSGNEWPVRAEFTGTGLTATVTQPTSGATDGDITTALTNAYPTQYDLIVTEFNDATNLDEVLTHLDSVGSATEQRPGVVLYGLVSSTVSAATTITSGRDNYRGMGAYLRGAFNSPMQIAAMVAAEVAGEPDRARPLNGVALNGLEPPAVSDWLTRSEQEVCLANGCAPLEVVGGRVRIVRSVTNYINDGDGNPDNAMMDLQTVRALYRVREVLLANSRARWSQVKIATKATGPNTTDPELMKAAFLGDLLSLQDEGLLERVLEHKDRLIVERDSLVPTRVNVDIPADVVDGLHVTGLSINLIYG